MTSVDRFKLASLNGALKFQGRDARTSARANRVLGLNFCSANSELPWKCIWFTLISMGRAHVRMVPLKNVLMQRRPLCRSNKAEPTLLFASPSQNLRLLWWKQRGSVDTKPTTRIHRGDCHWRLVPSFATQR